MSPAVFQHRLETGARGLCSIVSHVIITINDISYSPSGYQLRRRLRGVCQVYNHKPIMSLRHISKVAGDHTRGFRLAVAAAKNSHKQSCLERKWTQAVAFASGASLSARNRVSHQSTYWIQSR